LCPFRLGCGRCVAIGHGCGRRSGQSSSIAARVKLIIRIGIGNAQDDQGPGLEAFHLKSLSFLNVVMTQKMQEAVYHKVGKMLDKSKPLLERFAGKGLVGERDVADEPLHRRKRRTLWKAQHVRGLVDAAPVAVEDTLVRVVGQ
jgi:hypothetical protein